MNLAEAMNQPSFGVSQIESFREGERERRRKRVDGYESDLATIQMMTNTFTVLAISISVAISRATE